jgi:hypothetical protein
MVPCCGFGDQQFNIKDDRLMIKLPGKGRRADCILQKYQVAREKLAMAIDLFAA